MSFATLNFSKWGGGGAISPSSFAHEVILVKFELQTHMEHLSSCQSGVLVVFVLPRTYNKIRPWCCSIFSFQCIRNFLSAITYLFFCFVMTL